MDEHHDLLAHDDPELIAALEHHLQRLGWKRSELARRTRINSSTISDWLNGRYGPGSEAVRTLCTAFGVSRSQFWAKGEEIVAERRREQEERRRAEQVARLEAAGEAGQLAEVLLQLDAGLREEVLRIVMAEEKAARKAG